MAPRSTAPPFSPASASSLPRMPPVQPRPTTTTSTSFSLVAMSPSLAHVRDADRLVREFLVTVLQNVLAMHRHRAGEADQLPAGLVAVAAVDRVREQALHHGLIDRAPEHPRRQPVVEADLAGREGEQHLLALLLAESVEALAVGLVAVRVGRLDAGAVELRRRQRQLVALARHAELPRPLQVEAVALAPGAGERAVDIDVDADVGALGAELVRRHHVVDQRLDEGGLVEIEERVDRAPRRLR